MTGASARLCRQGQGCPRSGLRVADVRHAPPTQTRMFVKFWSQFPRLPDAVCGADRECLHGSRNKDEIVVPYESTLVQENKQSAILRMLTRAGPGEDVKWRSRH
jgi:hypothetical protein